jgi:hypothetical protein
MEFQKRKDEVILGLNEQGLNASLFWEVGLYSGKEKLDFFGRKLTINGHFLHSSHQIYNLLYFMYL